MNVSPQNLVHIRNSWFKNTFETGTSNGYNGPAGDISGDYNIPVTHSRLRASHNMFRGGVPVDPAYQLKRQEYEKYGYFANKDILDSLINLRAGQYGSCIVRFKRDKVVCTWTAADSLCSGYQPSLVTDPKAASFDSQSNVPLDVSEINDFNGFYKKYIRDYLELQYHGMLTMDCVESIAFRDDISGTQMMNEAKQWASLGIKVYYRTTDKNGDYILKEVTA